MSDANSDPKLFPLIKVAGQTIPFTTTRTSGGSPVDITGATYDWKAVSEDGKRTLNFDTKIVNSDPVNGVSTGNLLPADTDEFEVSGFVGTHSCTMILSATDRRPMWDVSPFILAPRPDKD